MILVTLILLARSIGKGPNELFSKRSSSLVMSLYDYRNHSSFPTDPIQITLALRQWKALLDTSTYKPNSHLENMENHLFPGLKLKPSSLVKGNFYHREKGIAICVGDKLVLSASILIKNLREGLKCNLPIEIFYGGNRDLNAENRVYLASLAANVTIVNILDFVDGSIVNPEGWAMKPFALLYSSFRKTILIDADVAFLNTPELIFANEPGFLETGTLFYKDRTYNDIPYAILSIPLSISVIIKIL